VFIFYNVVDAMGAYIVIEKQLGNYNSQTSNWENSRPLVGFLKKRLQDRGEW